MSLSEPIDNRCFPPPGLRPGGPAAATALPVTARLGTWAASWGRAAPDRRTAPPVLDTRLIADLGLLWCDVAYALPVPGR